MGKRSLPFSVLTLVVAASFNAAALAEDASYVFTIKDHRLSPETLKVPAGERVQLIVRNQDAQPEEFESYDLRRERIIPGGSEGRVWIGPLPEGRYEVFGDYHPKQVRGWVVAE